MGVKTEPAKKKRIKPFIAYHCQHSVCGEKIILIPSVNGMMRVNYSSLTEDDKFTLNSGGKIIYRHGVHVSHHASCRG